MASLSDECPRGEPPSRHAGGNRRGRILIAEDDLLLRKLVAECVRNLGHEAVTVSNGQAALAAVAVRPPDLLVCDVGMPILNGLEVCRRLKADSATQEIPVLLTSAIGQEYRRTGFEAGADDFLEKPFSPLELQTKIRDLLERQGFPGTGGAGT